MLKPLCHAPLPASAEVFRAALRKWFLHSGKDYPWRRTEDPYQILVSEVMLQQTRIATVLGRGFYTRFLERFPDIPTLAAADDDPLLKAWEGLGYYRRARMLREAARAIMERHGGVFPEDHAAILALPGVGRYTAGAITSFASNRPAPLVDGNVARVLARLFDHTGFIDSPASQKWLWEMAETLLDHAHPRIFNSALMELGQTVCSTGVPDCLSCPVAACCLTRQPEALPRKQKKAAAETVTEHAAWILKDGAFLLRRLGKGRREGMWRLPERPESALAGSLVLHERKYSITRYRVTLRVYQVPSGAEIAMPGEGELWFRPQDLESLVLPPADRAALEAILTGGEEIA